MATFSGGEKLEAALKEIASKLDNSGQLRVGFLENSTYVDGTSVPLVAITNEYGRPSKGQPPRPFFRSMIAEKSGTWPAGISQALIDNNYDAKKALNLTGHVIADQLQASITSFSDPPLAKSTVARKGFDKPLVDTDTMLRAVAYEVED